MRRFESNQIIRKITSEMRAGCKAIDGLHLRGYNERFEPFHNFLRCARNNHYYKVEDFDVDEMRSMDDNSGILEGFFLMAVRHRIEGIKGLFLKDMKNDSSVFQQ